jgi:rhodanese-related sulfurtransferase
LNLPNAETSTSVAFFLRKQGYTANAIRGGLEAWKEAGYPLEEKDE